MTGALDNLGEPGRCIRLSFVFSTLTWDISSMLVELLRYNVSFIDPSLPSDKYLKITNSLNRGQISILTQLRTGHAPINKRLHRIRKK